MGESVSALETIMRRSSKAAMSRQSLPDADAAERRDPYLAELRTIRHLLEWWLYTSSGAADHGVPFEEWAQKVQRYAR